MSERVWSIRVAQEFEVAAPTADAALAFAVKAEGRKIKGAKLVHSRSVLAEKRDEEGAS